MVLAISFAVCKFSYANSLYVGRPMLQPFTSVYYLMHMASQFRLYCNVIQDSRSPYRLWYWWLKDSNVISHQDNRFIIVGAFLFFVALDVNQHNGTYTCSAYEAYVSRAVTQSTDVVIESKIIILLY